MDQPAASVVNPRRNWILGVLCLSLLLVGMAMTILFLAIPDIARDLRAGPSDLQWVFAAYGVVFSGLVITSGALGDRFGRKRMLVIGLAVFGLAALVGAFSPTAEALIAARAVMGLGAALLMPGTLSILTSVFPEGERVQAIGIWSGVGGLGFILGPPIGGLLLSNFWWGSVMLVNVPIVVVALALTFRLVPESFDPGRSRLDGVGAALSIVAIGATVFVFIEAPTRGWLSAPVVAAAVVAVGGALSFVRRELSLPAPMLDVRLFRIVVFTVPALVITFGFFVAWGLQFLLPQYLQFIEGESVMTVGFVMATLSITWSIAAPTIPRVVARFGERLVIASSLLVTAAGVSCLTFVGTDLTLSAVIVGLLVIGAGMGAATTPTTAMLVSSLPPEKAGVGSAMNDVTRELGAAFGVAVLGSILTVRFTDQLATGVPRAIARQVEDEGGMSSVADVARSTGGAEGATLQRVADAAFTSGFRAALVVGALILVALAVLVFVTLPRPVDPERVDDFSAR